MARSRSRIFGAAISFFFFAAIGPASVGRWSTSGPPAGKPVTSIWSDPFHPGTLLAGTSDGLFRSRDRGETWALIRSGSIRSLAALPGSPIFAATADGLFRSDDGGDDWIDISAGLSSRDVRSVAFSGVLVAATATGVFRSRDSGVSWTFAYASASALEVAVQNGAPQTLYAALGPQGLAKSVDAGDHWSIVLSGPGIEIGHVAAGPAMVLAGDLPDVFGLGPVGLYVSRDGGTTWSRAESGPDAVAAVAIDPRDPFHGYASGGLFFGIAVYRTGALFETRDAGSTWRNIGLQGMTVTAIAQDPLDAAVLYAGTNVGVWRRSGPGSAWQQINQGIARARVTALGASSKVPGVIYAGADNGVFRSVDSGVRWADEDLFTDSAGLLLGFPLISSLAVASDDPNVCYTASESFVRQRPTPAARNGGVSRTGDGGSSWSTNLIGSVRVLALDPRASAVVYAGTAFPLGAPCCGGGVLKSVDGGATWSFANDGIPLQISTDDRTTYPSTSSLRIDPAAPDVLYLGTFGAGLFKSTNGGESWTSIPSSQTPELQSVLQLTISGTSPSVVYAGTPGTLLRTLDGGSSWERVGPLPAASISDLVVDPFDPEVLYAASDGQGVFRSTDHGKTWAGFDEGLADVHVHALAISPAAPRTLYAGTDGGVYAITVPLRASTPRPSPRIVTRRP